MAFIRVRDTLANEGLIREGLAWVFTRYCDRPICQGWKALEEEARKARRGLWSMPNPVPPWDLGSNPGETARPSEMRHSHGFTGFFFARASWEM